MRLGFDGVVVGFTQFLSQSAGHRSSCPLFRVESAQFWLAGWQDQSLMALLVGLRRRKMKPYLPTRICLFGRVRINAE